MEALTNTRDGRGSITVEGRGPEGKMLRVDVDLRDRLARYKGERNLSNADLGVFIGVKVKEILNEEFTCSATTVSKYLNDNMHWDVTKFEHYVRLVLTTVDRFALVKTNRFKDDVTEQVHQICEHIRLTAGFGGGFGEPGIGKTSGLELYANEHPDAILITIWEDMGTMNTIRNSIWEEMDRSTYDNRTPRSVWLKHQVLKRKRLIILDNAHKIKKSGWSWLCDFYDATENPLAFFGNPGWTDHAAADPQWSSRAWYQQHITLKNPDKAAKQMIALHAPASTSDELQARAEDVVIKPGAKRALRNQLRLMEFIKTPAITTEKAFAAAGTFNRPPKVKAKGRG